MTPSFSNIKKNPTSSYPIRNIRHRKNVHFLKFAHEKIHLPLPIMQLTTGHRPLTTAPHPPQPKVPSKNTIFLGKTKNLLTPRPKNSDFDT
jgi:hypothetical protein